MNMVVQLQDANGIPAEARTQADVIVSFSNGTINTPLITLHIPKGFDLAYATLPITQGTSGTFTVISNGLASASVKLDATNVPITLNLGAAKSTIFSNQTTPLYYSVQSFGLPVSGATLAWSATDGSISPSTSTTNSGGSASAVFTPAGPGVATITVSASSPLIGTKNSTTTIVVIAYPKAKASTLLGTILGNMFYLGGIIAGVAAAVVVVLLVVRRRRRSSVSDEDSFDIGPAPGEGTAFDLRVVFQT
ncbi:MAG: Ig-like domain-containing protein [Thaumarchaeota archaeon]|nr:Ig-like domain-containing protein [Nitrososphaerota archaeon]